ncbi:MAG: hypothetical protein ACTHLO_19595 [Pseudolabrys sp.]
MTSTLVRALAVVAALAAFGSAAHAFTFQGAQGATGGSALVDPDSRYGQQKPQTDQNGRTVIQNGNTSLHFGGSSSANQNYNPNNMFDPFYRDGR